jgi:flagellar basal-body rod protein FlgC
MDFFTAMDISASALTAERTRMNLISGNLANANSTRSADGGPYKKKSAVMTATPLTDSFNSALNKAGKGLDTVKISEISEDSSPPKMQYDPTHPDANPQWYVALPNINVLEEMADMITASRVYEANVTAAQASKNMALKTLELGK